MQNPFGLNAGCPGGLQVHVQGTVLLYQKMKFEPLNPGTVGKKQLSERDASERQKLQLFLRIS